MQKLDNQLNLLSITFGPLQNFPIHATRYHLLQGLKVVLFLATTLLEH